MNAVLKLPPGAIGGDVHAPLFATDVCVTESLLTQVTLLPTATVIGFGANAVDVSVDAPLTMATLLPPPDVGVVGDDDEPQAVVTARTQMATATRKLMPSLRLPARQIHCLPPRGAFVRERIGPIAHEVASAELRDLEVGYEFGAVTQL